MLRRPSKPDRLHGVCPIGPFGLIPQDIPLNFLKPFAIVVSLPAAEGQTMRRPFLAFSCFAVLGFTGSLQAATTPSRSTQDVRFSEKTIPNGIAAPPQVIIHPSPAYTVEARRLGIQGSVIVQAQFDADGNFKVLRIVKGLGYESRRECPHCVAELALHTGGEKWRACQRDC